MSTWIYVRATINTGGVARGEEMWIDADDTEQFGPLLEARYLKPVDAPESEYPPDEWDDDQREEWGLPPLEEPPA